MHALLDHAAARYRDSVCIADDSLALTYAEVARLASRIANTLHASGVARGEHTAVLSVNHPYAFAVSLGCMRAGAPPLPINPMSVVADVAEQIVRNDVCWLFFHSSFAEIVAALEHHSTPLRGAVCLDTACESHPSLTQWTEKARDTCSGPGLAPDDIACMFSSGGTTGAPKGVQIPLRSLNTMVASFMSCMPVRERPVYLASTPISHGAVALAWSFMAHGVRTVLLRRPEPDLLLRTVRDERVSMLFLPPTVIYNLLETPAAKQLDCSSLQYLLYSAAPMSPDRLAQAMDVFGPVLCQTFGQAEAPIICTYFSPEAHSDALGGHDRSRLQSCGRPTPFTAVSVMDEQGRHLDPGQVGEIVVSGDLVMAGYYRNPQASAEVSQFGWHHTGDLGWRDEEGFYHVVDRKRDMIISGGFNVYPSEVERRLLAHPAVRDCVVIGVPDPKWGEAVKAVVELASAAAVEPDELVRFVREELGPLKTPKSVEIWRELPRSSVGKVLRRHVRERFWAEQERRI